MWVNLLWVPSPTSRITVRAARAVLAATGHAFDEIAEPTMAALARAIAARRHPHVFYRADAPDSEVLRTLRESGTPLAIALADPADAVRHVLPGRSFNDALATAAMSFAVICEAHASHPSVRVPDAASATVGELLDGLGAAFGIDLPPDRRADAARRLGVAALDVTLADAARVLTPVSPDTAEPPLTEAQHAIVAHVLSPFAAAAGPVERVVWPGALFVDPAGTPHHGPVAMLGAKRLIGRTTGHLPAGMWHARLDGRVDGNISGNGLSVLIAAGDTTVTASMRLPDSGAYHTDLMLEVDDPRRRIVARVSTTEGAIEGTLALDALTWLRQG